MTEIERLKDIVQTLRSDHGCPWDREQTHASLKPECIEEAAEVVCGINILEKTGNAENLKEELGDLLLQVMFHAVIAEEEGLGDIRLGRGAEGFLGKDKTGRKEGKGRL